MKNQKKYSSNEEILSGCRSTTLKSRVSSILRNKTHIEWNLVACSEKDRVGRAEFISPIKGMGSAYHLTCETTPRGEYMHISVVDAEINQHSPREIK